MKASYLDRHPGIRDIGSVSIFIVCVVLGTIFINTFVFRSFNVVGPSMEKTLYTGDRLIVNRLPVTWAQIQNKPYTPERGQIIVFKNPKFNLGTGDEYIVKRVIALPGEHVTLVDGSFTVYNRSSPGGFNPDEKFNGEPGLFATGEVDMTVPNGELFVTGDHREGNYSYDSRNGLGTVPLYDVIGPVGVRIYPLDEIRLFWS